MESADRQRVALMVIRVWRDQDSGAFRARIQQTVDPSEAPRAAEVVTTRDDVVAEVVRWLDRL